MDQLITADERYATWVSESSSSECSWMKFRAFQISTGSARLRFGNVACVNRFAGGGIIIIMPHQAATETLMLSVPWQLLA